MNDMERRPEFAPPPPPQPMQSAPIAGPSRIASVPQHTSNNAYRPSPLSTTSHAVTGPAITGPSTPLRSAHEVDEMEIDQWDSFDAEFADDEMLKNVHAAGQGRAEM